MWEGELLYNTDDKDESTNLAWLVDSNEDCEDENDEDTNGWFVVERVVEGVSVIVFVFVYAAFGTTVDMLMAAAEDEDGDCNLYPDR